MSLCLGLGLSLVHGGAFSALSLVPSMFLDTQPPFIFQDSAGTTPATANNDPVGRSNDRSANAFNCTQSIAGRRPLYQTSKGLLYDGVDDLLIIPSGLPTAIGGGNAVSLACWFKGTVFQSAIRLQPAGANYIILGFNSLTPEFAISTDGGVGLGVNISGVEDGAWHHVVGTWQRNTTNGFKVYVDGVISAQKNSADVALPVLTPSLLTPGIGGYLNDVGTPSELTTGTLDQMLVFNYALSAGQVAALRNGTIH